LKTFKWILTGILGIAIFTTLNGCSGTVSGITKGVLDKVFEDTPPKVVIRITSDNDINPDITGRPSPIVLRIYALKSDDIFNNADFFAIYEQDKTILGDTMTAREEVELAPGDSIEMEKEFDMETTHVGVMAAYRDLDNAVWRGSIVTPVNETTYVDVKLERLTLSVKPGKK
jgi:type VI secretion system protein VasD